MEHQHHHHWPAPARPTAQRERSNSLPMVEALGCSTPEARLLLAEGRAAVRTRRSRRRRNCSEHDASIAPFNPRDHLHFLDAKLSANQPQPQPLPLPSETRHLHTRVPSSSSVSSTSTIIPRPPQTSDAPDDSTPSPLGDYSAHLAEFIKAQLKNIPSYTPGTPAVSPLSPRSCPDLSFDARSPSHSPRPMIARVVDAPRMIHIPPIRPPAVSQFSAWSSTDDGTDDDLNDDVPPSPDADTCHDTTFSAERHHALSLVGCGERAGESSFLFSSTPAHEEPYPGPAKEAAPDNEWSRADFLPQDISPPYFADEHMSTALEHSQALSDSSTQRLSYFDFKRPVSITQQMRDRIVAAVTPPASYSKMLTAVSPWEGAALASVHDVVVESQHRVHVDGLSFDMQRDFVLPSHIGTPC